MIHELYTDGDAYHISWAIRTDQKNIMQRRNQASIYRGIVSEIQAKFMALHVGLFWGVGVFAIKRGDHVNMMIDSKDMVPYLVDGTNDKFIGHRIRFVNLLIEQKELTADISSIQPTQNIALLQNTDV